MAVEEGDEVPAAEVWDCAAVEEGLADVFRVATEDFAAEEGVVELQPAATQYAYPTLCCVSL